jgi:predicted nucleotidyltransferase component of viral defense system
MAILRIRNEFELQDVIDELREPPELVVRDFALMTIAARLTERFPDRLCFKGGFVLRHVYGHARFSADIDATRVKPPKHKLNSGEIAEEISRASSNLLTLKVSPPETDSGRSLDFHHVAFAIPMIKGVVSVEISYREDVLDPQTEYVGPPYYESFPITVLSLDEIVAEKLRALCQAHVLPISRIWR